MTGEWELLLEDVRGGKLPLAQLEEKMEANVERLINEIRDL